MVLYSLLKLLVLDLHSDDQVPEEKDGCKEGVENNVKYKEKEWFSVPKAYAVVDPGTMMVHVKHTSLAGRAMMSSFRLKQVAHEAIPLSFGFVISKMKPPKSRNLSGVSEHCCQKAPNLKSK